MAVSPTTVWIAILGGAIGSFGLRLSFIALFGRIDSIPPRVELVLRFVPAAVLAALVVPALVAHGGTLDLSPDNHRLLAGGVAAVVAWHTEDMLATIAVGMGTLWALTWLL